jgi:hypothetical protein
VPDEVDPAVARFRGEPDGGAVFEAQPLVAEAHAEQRDARTGDDVSAEAEVGVVPRAARSWGDHHVVETVEVGQPEARVVVRDDDRIVPVHPCEVLEQVERERVVVVDQQRAHDVRHGTC